MPWRYCGRTTMVCGRTDRRHAHRYRRKDMDMAFTLHAGNPPLDPRLAQVLEYWLGAEQPTDATALARKQLWFSKDEAVDEEIRHRFGAVMQEALSGRLNG